MSAHDFTLAAYIVAAVCFILALRGLSHPETSRKGNILGMSGMAVAILTTLISPVVQSYFVIILAVAIGGAVGTYIALKVKMTALPQLVAAFHSLVGMAAVLVATGALLSPESYNIGSVGSIHPASLVEMSLGRAIGAITFSGSVIAFAKLQGLMSGSPITFKGQHWLNMGLVILAVVLIVVFAATESYTAFFLLMILAFALGFLIIEIGRASCRERVFLTV